jgi:tRNA-specific 2-thiouridylase
MALDRKLKVAVGLSGGVDSSVSAYLLQQAGYDVTGVHMMCWDSKIDGCTADKDRADAVSVAAKLNIKFEPLNFVDQYKARVIDYFYSEYEKGRTPNPDVMCNKEIKFGLFLDWAINNGFDYIATGHYARVSGPDAGGVYSLLKGVDETKDQSYFLYLLDQQKLSKVLFPVGNMQKTEVRKTAKQAELPVFNKPDSMGICFVGEVDIKSFLKTRIKEKKGDVVNSSGDVLGTHNGVWFYTIGQRHGFTIDKYVGMPLYVIGKDVEKNHLVVGFAKEAQQTLFKVEEPHWIGANLLDNSSALNCEVRVRHLGQLYKATLNRDLLVATQIPVTGIASGQCAVFYQGDKLVGGAIIA